MFFKKYISTHLIKKSLVSLLIFSLCLTNSTLVSADTTTKSPYNGSVYTQQSKHYNDKIFHGIDVSFYQKTIDWNKAKADGVDYAFIRLGYRGSAQATLNMDTMYDTNMKGAAAAGVRTGIYFFTQAITVNEAIEEANYCINNMKGYTVNMPVAIDFESVGGAGRMYSAKLSTEKYTAIVSAFCDTIAAAGYTPAVYSSYSEFHDKLNGEELSSKYRIWLAHYASATTFEYNYQFWQYSSVGKIDGIPANVDCNFFYTSTNLDSAVGAVITAPVSGSAVGDISNANIKVKGSTRSTGEALEPELKVTLNGNTLVKNSDYTAVFTDNIYPGLATVTVTGINNFTGVKTQTFIIKPKNFKKFKAAIDNETVNLNWGKLSGSTGFELYRKDTYNDKYNLIADIIEPETFTYSDLSVLSGKYEKYYRIRGYITVNDTRYYTNFVKLTVCAKTEKKCWSTIKTYVTKKPKGGRKLALVTPYKRMKYLGDTLLKNGKYAHHVIYKTPKKKVEGYIKTGSNILFK